MRPKAIALLLSVLLLLLPCAGCAGEPASGAGPSGGGGREIGLTEAHKDQYAEYLWPLAYDGTLFEGKGALYGVPQELDVVKAVLREDVLVLTTEVYGEVYRDPETGGEKLGNVDLYGENAVAVLPPEDDPHYPLVLWGTSTAELRGSSGESDAVTCRWEPLENPGRRVLEEAARKAADQIAASERPDLSQYDQRMVDCLYGAIASRRLIGGPEEITLWDLENLCTDLTVSYDMPRDPATGMPENVPPMGSELLRLCPNLRTCTVYAPLSDYSVFEGMEQLESLRFCGEIADPQDFSNLRIGHVRHLEFTGFRGDIAIDLAQSPVDTLEIHSWVASVTGFRGCGRVRQLSFRNTRSDTRIINAETFPGLEALELSFYSEIPRVRDLSRLGTFGENVKIGLTLSYQACNDRTVASLAGVRLDTLTLDPEGGGPWPLEGEPDPALVEAVKADQVVWSSRPR